MKFTKAHKIVLPSPPPMGAGKRPKTLETSREVPHQDEPTADHPISAHKQMAGHEHPGSIPHWDSRK
jgi:hypothetical protein